MFNTVAIRIHPVAGATRAEVVRDARTMANKYGEAVVFDWNGVKDFVVEPFVLGEDVAKALDERMKAQAREFSVKRLALPVQDAETREINRAADLIEKAALDKLHDLGDVGPDSFGGTDYPDPKE